MNFLYKNFLIKEIQKWEESGMVDKATAQKLAQHYQIDLQKTEDKKSFVLQMIAYLFIALAFFTIIGANWDDIPREVRLAMVLAINVGVNWAGFHFLKKGKEGISTGLFFLGNFCFGGAIALIAQIYHLGEHMPNGILLWAIGAMAMSLAVGRAVLVAQSLWVAMAWFFLEKIEYYNIEYGFIIFILLSGWMLWRETSKFLALSLYICLGIYLSSFGNVVGDYLGLAYSVLGISISPLLERVGRKEIGEHFQNASIWLGVIFLMILMMWGDNIYSDSLNLLSFGMVYGVISLLSLMINILQLIKTKSKERYFLLGISAFLFALPMVSHYFDMKIIFSLINVILGGILIRQNRMTLGLSLIFFVAIVRYLDLVGDYIGASVLFLIFAVLILIINFKRKRNEK